MINKTQNKKLKKVLKHGFMKQLINKLDEKQILTVKKESYKKSYLSNVLNGRESNKLIENVIFELYDELKQQLTKINVERKKLLENKKSEAVTSDSN